MTTALSLFLALSLLPPEAARHDQAAMTHYDAGRLDAAEAEFRAAYAALPDPQRDREDRDAVLGSLRGLLLVMHDQSGAPEPLCRLRDALRAHLDALPSPPAGAPEPPDITGNRERLSAVTGQLAAFPADACEPAPPPAAEPAAEPAPPPPAAVAPPAVRPTPAAPPDGPTPRQLRITGGVTLGLGVVLLAVMTSGLVISEQQLTAGRTIKGGAADRPFTPDERDRLEDHLGRARNSESLALGTGISSAVFTIISVGLFAAATSKMKKNNKSNTHQNRVLLAPWRTPSGVGVTLSMTLP